MLVQVIVDLHHVQNSTLHDDQAPLRHEVLILHPHGRRQLVQGQRCDVVSALDAKGAIPKRKQEGKGAEVVALGKVCPQGAGHLPKSLPAMGESLLIGEVVGVALHGQPEPLCQHIVAGGGGRFCPVNVLLVGLVGHGLSQIGVCLDPHVRIGDLFHGVQLVPPDGYVLLGRADTLKNVHQLHFDGIARSVSDRALGAGGDDQVVVQLGCALLNGTDDILPGVRRRKPLIHRGHFAAESLELVHRHGTDLHQGAGDEVLDPLLCRGQLDAVGSGAGGVLQGTLGHELKHRASRSGDGGLDGVDDLLRLLHGGGCRNLMSRRAVHHTEISLDAGVVEGLGRASSHNEVLLLGQPLLDPLRHIPAAPSIRVRHIDRAVVEIVPSKHLFAPELEGIQKMQVGAIS